MVITDAFPPSLYPGRRRGVLLARIHEEDRGYDTPCWIWEGAHIPEGYSVFKGPAGTLGHRNTYTAVFGAIADGLTLDHLCRHRPCINPAHLEPVTRGENVLRGEGITAKNALKTHCPKGHLYDYVTPDGKRSCKTCRANARDAYRAKQRAAGLPVK